MRVVATERGFDNQKMREVGEEFDMPPGAAGSWFEPVKGDDEPARRKPGPKPKTEKD